MARCTGLSQAAPASQADELMTTQSRINAGFTRGKVPLAWRLVVPVLRRARCGSLRVELPGGVTEHIQGDRRGPHARLSIHRPAVLLRFITAGETGLLEAYMNGDWDTPDLAGLLEWGGVNEPWFGRVLSGHPGVRLMGRLVHALRSNTRRGSRRNIASHYDLGNDFYGLWLDTSLAYSCGIYHQPEDDLARAQQHKFDRMLGLLALQPEHHLLEIGAGWGGFAIHAARQTGCRVTGLTVSREQLQVSRERAREAGVEDRVSFRFEDYRDHRGQYDRVVSIEMFEAVGERYWPAFFQTLYERLLPGGRAALQVITIDDELFPAYRREADFIQRYIFPGGMLPPVGLFEQHAREAGLRTELKRFFGQHYAHTLACWQQRLEQAGKNLLDKGYDASFQRMWACYLAYCQAGFRTGRIDLMQTLLLRESGHG